MSTYLKFFALERSPFDGEDQSKVVLGTRALRDALATIQTGLDEGAARICVSGDSGLGKTSLARALPKLLRETTRAALVLDPSKGWDALRGSLAKQWGIREGGLARARLIEASRDRRLVLVLDQSEKASEEFLDHLDVLLSYRTEEDEPVVQSVLLANLGPDENGDMPPVVWWLDRIHTLQLEFAPLPRSGVESYIQKHLKRAGHGGGELFTSEAAQAIHGYTGGVPGQVGRLCEELLEEAASQNLATVDACLVHEFCEPSKTAVDEAVGEAAEAPVHDCVAPPQEPQTAQARDEQISPVQVDRRVAVGADRTLELIDDADRTSDDEAYPGDDRTESYGYDGHDGSVGSADDDPTWDEPHEDAYGQEVPPLRAIDAIEDEIGEESGDEVAGTLESVAEDEDREGIAGETGEDADEREAFEQFLAQPATEAELRAIRGGGFARYAKAVGGVAAAAIQRRPRRRTT
jgi:type II secretory pathway predicted ATPase ExeA